MTIPIERLATGIPGLDDLLGGGLPKGRSTLITGSSGSGKTVLAAQYLAAGIAIGESGVFVTFEETPEDLRRNTLGFGWDIAEWEAQGKWAFVDASPRGKERTFISGDFDFGALLARVQHAVKKVSAKRVVVDSLGAVFITFKNPDVVRGELLRLTEALKELDVTSLVSVERMHEYGEISRYGVEEFVTDNVIILRNGLVEERRRRTMEVLKLRGVDHSKGEYPFTVIKGHGIIAVPLSALVLPVTPSNERVSFGNQQLDDMCCGGVYSDSSVLVSGATGTGKTLLATQFVASGARAGQKSLYFGFEEGREQLIRNAGAWGFDLKKLEDEGSLRIETAYPESKSLEDHLVLIKEAVVEWKPKRVVVDSLTALERVTTAKTFREFVLGLTGFLKHQHVLGVLTTSTASLVGGSSVTETDISTIADSVILLRYVEMYGELRRGITVLKLRGSNHEKKICELMIDDDGMHIGRPLRNVNGVLSGNTQYVAPSDLEKIEEILARRSV